MFNHLQQRWKVNKWQLILIILTFAIGGSLTGYLGKKMLNLFAIHLPGLWIIVYIVLIILLWPIIVLLISLPLGQFRFFIKYVRKIGARFGITNSKIRVAIFASGTGTNAEKIIEYFRNSSVIKIALIVCNNPQAGVLKIAQANKIPTLLIEKEKFFRGGGYMNELKKNKIVFIVLAGFLWKIPTSLLKSFPNKIINIHPALLPKYGGKGMYGSKVHEAVLANKEKESGISIHFVDEIYDHGKIIFQAKCPVLENDTTDSLAQRIHALEHEYYPKVIGEILRSDV